MGRIKGGATTPLSAPSQDGALRYHIKCATAGKTDLTADELVDILCSTYPYTYSTRNRKLLIERVSKFLPPKRSAPPVKKPRIIREIETIALDGDEASSSDREISANSDSERGDDELGHEKDVNGGKPPISGDLGGNSGELGRGKDANGRNPPISGDLGGKSGELGHGENVRESSNRLMFKDLGGIDSVVNELTWEVIVPVHQLEMLQQLGVEPTTRILLHGPPRCGKTSLVRALANEAGLPLFEMSAADLVSGVSGALEEKIRELFSTACARAPSIVFIDEIDAMTSKTENSQKETEPAIVNQLMACMDEANKLIKPLNHDVGSESSTSNSRPGYVLVIAATNRPDVIDPALRRSFDREIAIDGPDVYGREKILLLLTRSLKVEDGIDLLKIARCTLGFVGGDLVELVKKAGVCSVKRIMDMRKRLKVFSGEDYYKRPFSNQEMKNVSITMADFVEAAKMVKPSSKVEDFTVTPTAKWDDVGGLESLKREFERHVIKPIKFPDVFEDLDVDFTTAYFLYGPSGCGKAFIVEALANEAGAKFMHIKGPELVKVYGCQSELVLQIIFRYAMTCTPCIIFFDEVEADFSHELPTSVLKKLLRELDAAEEGGGVYIIVATNRPFLVSYGRSTFQDFVYVPPPTPEERGAILKALARNKPIDADVDLMAIGKDSACTFFNITDLSALMKKAAEAAMDRPTSFRGGCRLPWTIKDEDFKSVLRKISPSTTHWDISRFLHEKMIASGGSPM